MKKTVLVSVIGGAVVIAGAVYVLSGSGSAGIPISMEDYISGRIGNAHCTLSMNEHGGKIDTDLYISGLRMRMDNTVVHEGGTMTSHILNDGEYVHVWGNGQAFSMKYDPEQAADTGAFGPGTDQELADVLSNQQMKCVKWKVDESLLTKPKDVTFTDLSAALEFENMFDTVEGGAAPTEPEPLDVTQEEAEKLLKQLQEGAQNGMDEDYFRDLME
ncbi:MAG: hypothetical protein WCX61_01965 [Candidatus Peribacteraceae bacterium]|jgi:hypothetical protein